MADFTIITGNKHKLSEFKRLIPNHLSFDSRSVDLNEIQSLDLNEIVKHKVIQAYKLIKQPVVVEDVSASLDSLNGLPGPFIKYFEEALGRDALYQLAGQDVKATVVCTIGYYNGKDIYLCSGTIHGKVVPMTSNKGFGFDAVFMPIGESQTFGDMRFSQKDKISHRAIAVSKLVEYLSNNAIR